MYLLVKFPFAQMVVVQLVLVKEIGMLECTENCISWLPFVEIDDGIFYLLHYRIANYATIRLNRWCKALQDWPTTGLSNVRAF